MKKLFIFSIAVFLFFVSFGLSANANHLDGYHLEGAETPKWLCEELFGLRWDTENRIKYTSEECIVEGKFWPPSGSGNWSGVRDRLYFAGDNVCLEWVHFGIYTAANPGSNCAPRVYEQPIPQATPAPTKAPQPTQRPQQPVQQPKPTVDPRAELQERELIVGVDAKEGETIKGQKGVVTKVLFNDGSRVDVLEGGELKLLNTQDGNKETSLLQGIFRVLMKNCDSFVCKVNIRLATVSIRGTEFTVEADASRVAIRVIEGVVAAIDVKGHPVNIKTGQEVVFSKAGASKVLSFDKSSVNRWWKAGEKLKPGFFVILFIAFATFWLVVIILIVRAIRNAIRKRRAKQA